MSPRGQDQPQADERQRHEAETDGAQPAERGEGDDREAGEGVAGPPRHGVDERLRGELHLGGHGQVEQLHRGPVDRVAQHLVDALEEHGRREGAGDEEASRSEEEADRQEEEDRAQAEPPQDACGQEHLGRHAKHAHRRVERAEEGGEGVLRDERPLRHGLELPARDRGHERGDHHDPRDRAQVGGAQHQPEAVPQPVPRPGSVCEAADGGGPPLPEGADGQGREQQQGRHQDQQALGPEEAGHRAREDAPDRGAQGRSRPHEAEQAARLAGREDVVRERPHLGGREHAEDADPDVDDGEEPGAGSAAGQDGQRERHHAEEGEAAGEQPVEPQPPSRADVEGDRGGHEQEEGEVREGQERGLEPAEEERVARHLPDEVGRDHQEEVGEEQQPAGKVAALEAKESLEGPGHGETGALEQTLAAVYTLTHAFPKGRPMKRDLLVAAIGLAALPLRAQAPAPAAPAAATPVVETQPNGSKVWIGRYAEFEEFLRTAPVERVDKIPVGVTKPERGFFAPGGIAGSAAVKHLPMGQRAGFWEAYKSEIAAYQLDRLLGLDMVPPTVERRVGSDLASVQLWVEGVPGHQGRGPEGVPEARRVGEAGAAAEGLRQPDREHRPQPGQHPGGRRVEPHPHRPLARVRQRQDALHEGDDPDRPGVLREAEGPRRGFRR